jgi:hypothetical protein
VQEELAWEQVERVAPVLEVVVKEAQEEVAVQVAQVWEVVLEPEKEALVPVVQEQERVVAGNFQPL